MENKYFIKLVNNEKIYVSDEEFDQYLHRYKGDFIVIQRPLATIYVPRESIVLCGKLNDLPLPNKKGRNK